METLNCISGQCVDQFEASTSPLGQPPRTFEHLKLVRSKTHLPPTLVPALIINCFKKGEISDRDFLVELSY